MKWWLIYLSLLCSVATTGCKSEGSRSANHAAKYSLTENLAAATTGAMPESCIHSLEMIPSAFETLAKHGVTPSSPGLFFVTAGDSFLTIDVTYVGHVDRGYVVSSSGRDIHQNIDEPRYQKVLDLARMDVRATKADPNDSVRDHDSCEYIVLPAEQGGIVYAVQQSMSGSRDGAHSYGGFANLRKFLRSLLGLAPNES
jgi:hypothetical protein